MSGKYLYNLAVSSVEQNYQNILSMVEPDSSKNALMLDLGCDDGEWTSRVAAKIGNPKIEGLEIVDERAKMATEKGIKVYPYNLNDDLPLKSNSYSFIHSNQVIEHLIDTDKFISEIHRLLIPGGYAVISTENLSGWHNIFALVLGFQPFSMTNYSKLGSVGNPFALWKDKKADISDLPSWQHNRLFSYKGLVDLFQKHKFKVESVKTAGYYPLPGFISKLDPIHGHWIAIKIRKI